MRLTVATAIYRARPDLADNVASMMAGNEPKDIILIENGTKALDGQYTNAVRIHNEENVGVTKALQQALDLCQTEILALFHDDVSIMDSEWDSKVLAAFDADPLLGMVTFFGCPGVMSGGGRGGVKAGVARGYTNMVNGDVHGERRLAPRAIAVPDSFSLIYRRDMVCDMGGFDMRFVPDHGYDHHLALQFLSVGYHNIYMPIRCLHGGSRTRRHPDYAKFLRQTEGIDDFQLMMRNRKLRAKIWEPCLPLFVNEDFSVGARDPLLFVNAERSILGYKGNSEYPVFPNGNQPIEQCGRRRSDQM